MKEILFKAKTVDTGEWVYGYYVRLPDAAGSVHIMHVPANNPDECNKVFYIDPKTLEQVTELAEWTVHKTGHTICSACGGVVKPEHAKHFKFCPFCGRKIKKED